MRLKSVGNYVTTFPTVSASDIEDPILLSLSPRKERFVAEYLIDLNATQAAVRAGYSENSAQPVSSRLMDDPAVVAMIERRQAQRASNINVTQASVINEVHTLAMSNVAHYTVDDNGDVQLAAGAPDNAMAAIESIKRRKTIREDKAGNITIVYDVEIKLHDKPGQLKLLGRHVGLFPNKVEHTGKDGGPIETVTKVERVVVDVPAGRD